MRLIVSLLAALIICSNALAEQSPPSEAALQSARTISSLFADPVFADEVENSVVAQRQDEYRRPLLSGPFYDSLRPDTQRSLTAFVDTMPQLVREEVRLTMLAVADEMTRRLAARFSESELAALAAMFSEPAVRAAILDAARASLRGESSSWAPTNAAELETVLASPSMRGAPDPAEVLRVMNEANAAVQQIMRPRVEQRVLGGLCAAMADECPAHVRRMITLETAN